MVYIYVHIVYTCIYICNTITSSTYKENRWKILIYMCNTCTVLIISLYTGDLDESLAPPPLDQTVSVDERLAAVRQILQQSRDPPGSQPQIASFDLKTQYKTLSQICGISVDAKFKV